ncbi:MAG: OmpA family protein [Myxococcota bacterium]
MRLSLLLAVVVVSSGCVTQGTYDLLQADRDKQVATLKERDKEIADLKAALKAEEATVKQLSSKIAELEAAYGQTQSDKSALEGALAELKKRKEETEARVAEFKALLEKFKSLIDAGKLKVTIRDGRMVVELATDILFASGSASLSKDGKAAIIEVAELLKTIPVRKFQVEGHTDNVPMKGAFKSNWELAAARALTVLHTMVDAGLAPERISAASFGDSRPTRDNSTPENRAANRRIEIVVMPDLSSLPGFEELRRVQ